jgi:hypothetical protein
MGNAFFFALVSSWVRIFSAFPFWPEMAYACANEAMVLGSGESGAAFPAARQLRLACLFVHKVESVKRM